MLLDCGHIKTMFVSSCRAASAAWTRIPQVATRVATRATSSVRQRRLSARAHWQTSGGECCPPDADSKCHCVGMPKPTLITTNKVSFTVTSVSHHRPLAHSYIHPFTSTRSFSSQTLRPPACFTYFTHFALVVHFNALDSRRSLHFTCLLALSTHSVFVHPTFKLAWKKTHTFTNPQRSHPPTTQSTTIQPTDPQVAERGCGSNRGRGRGWVRH
jgi:hypothetical protein